MKILHVIPSLGAGLGGPAQVAMNLVKALRDRGIDTEIATTNYDYPQPIDVPLHQRIEYRFENGSIPVWFLPYNSPALKEFIFSSAFTTWCWRHLHRYDLIDNHYLFSYTSTCAATIARRQGIPCTIRTMGQLSPWALAQSRLKKQIYTNLVERRNLNNAAAIHCTTPEEAADVRRFGVQTPTVTLPLGVNPPIVDPDAKAKLRQKYAIPSEVPIILFLSRLHYKKRPELLLQSLAELKAQGSNFHLIMAGTGEPDYLKELQQLVASLDITDRVSFPGLVTGFDKDILLQGSDLFALPSFSENFGIAVAEALAVGLPVVITAGIQIAPAVEAAQAGMIVPGEVEPLAQAIDQLLRTPELRHQLGENGRQLARTQYDWRAIAQRLIPVYTEIAAKKTLSKDRQFDV